MNCSNPILHVIKPRDSLYQLARYYQTTIQMITALNPNLNPYNLQVGSTLTICPGTNSPIIQDDFYPAEPNMNQTPMAPGTSMNRLGPAPTIPNNMARPTGMNPTMPNNMARPTGMNPTMPNNMARPTGTAPMMPNGNTMVSEIDPQMELDEDMRAVWAQHVNWTRMLMISIIERLRDQTAVSNRLLRNPQDMAKIFARFYPENIAKNVEQLFREHLRIGGDLMTALRDRRMQDAENLNQEWYANADNIAETLSSINPYYDKEVLRNMLYNHLDLLREQIQNRIAANYPADIDAFDAGEEEAMDMADYFADGIMQQFPENFIQSNE